MRRVRNTAFARSVFARAQSLRAHAQLAAAIERVLSYILSTTCPSRNAIVAEAEMPTADHAKVLLEEVAARYASITSYSDCGAVHTQFIDNDRKFTTVFSTLYKKPLLYRFEFERPHLYPPLQNSITRNAVVFDGSTAYSWKQTGTDPPQTEFAENFSLAIAAATTPNTTRRRMRADTAAPAAAYPIAREKTYPDRLRSAPPRLAR